MSSNTGVWKGKLTQGACLDECSKRSRFHCRSTYYGALLIHAILREHDLTHSNDLGWVGHAGKPGLCQTRVPRRVDVCLVGRRRDV